MSPLPPADLEHRPRWLSFLPALLFRDEKPARYIAVAWLLCFGGSMLLSLLVHLVVPQLPGPDFGKASPAYLLFLVVIFSPIVETLMMAGVLLLLTRFVSAGVAVAISAVGWGLLHSSIAPAWGMVIWWPFLIFSIAFLTWSPRGFWPAVGLVALTHGLQNLPSALMVALSR